MSLTKTKKVMAEYTTYLVCFCLLKLNQGTWKPRFNFNSNESHIKARIE
jgi:hypothetical protein